MPPSSLTPAEGNPAVATLPGSSRRAEVVVTGGIVINAALGFLSQASLAASQGAGYALDAYFAGAALPTAIVAITATALGGAVIPELAHRSPQDAQGLEGELIGLTLAIGLAIAALGVAGTLLAPGVFFSGERERVALAARVGRWFWLASGAGFLVQILGVVENRRRAFAVPAAVSVLLPASIVIAATLWGKRYGPEAIAASYAAASLLQVIALWAATRGRVRIHRPSRSAVVVLLVAAPVALAVLPNTFAAVSDAYWSGLLPAGTLSYLGVANRVTIAIASIVVTGMAITSFPEMADMAAASRITEMRAFAETLILRSAALLIPLAAIGAALRLPGTCAVFERGSFSAEDCAKVASLLPFYLAGMIGMAIGNLNSRVFYALRDTRTPALIGIAAIVLYTALSGVAALMGWMEGIAAAFMVTWLLVVAVQLWLLRPRIGNVLGRPSVRALAGLLVIAAGVGGAASGVAARLDPNTVPQPWLFAGVGVTAVCGLAAYAILARKLLGVRVI